MDKPYYMMVLLTGTPEGADCVRSSLPVRLLRSTWCQSNGWVTAPGSVSFVPDRLGRKDPKGSVPLEVSPGGRPDRVLTFSSHYYDTYEARAYDVEELLHHWDFARAEWREPDGAIYRNIASAAVLEVKNWYSDRASSVFGDLLRDVAPFQYSDYLPSKPLPFNALGRLNSSQFTVLSVATPGPQAHVSDDAWSFAELRQAASGTPARVDYGQLLQPDLF